jgi:hypothetical protein
MAGGTNPEWNYIDKEASQLSFFWSKLVSQPGPTCFMVTNHDQHPTVSYSIHTLTVNK